MSLFHTWIIVAAVVLLSACADTGPHGHGASKPFTEFSVLTAEQSFCAFGCSAFELTIFADGRVIHSGPAFEHTGGPHVSSVDRQSLELIAKALRDAGFDEMRDRYVEGDGCEGAITDRPVLSFSVSAPGRKKSVVLDTGCVGPAIPSERISALIKAIDQVSGTTALIEQRKKLAPKECVIGCG